MYGVMYRFGRKIMQGMFALVLLGSGIGLYVVFDALVYLVLGAVFALVMIAYSVVESLGVKHND